MDGPAPIGISHRSTGSKPHPLERQEIGARENANKEFVLSGGVVQMRVTEQERDLVISDIKVETELVELPGKVLLPSPEEAPGHTTADSEVACQQKPGTAATQNSNRVASAPDPVSHTALFFISGQYENEFSAQASVKTHSHESDPEQPSVVMQCQLCSCTSQACKCVDSPETQLLEASQNLYKCHVCEATYSNKNDLKEHQVFHFGVNQFKCELCNASFGRASDCKRHQNYHTREEAFKCDICGDSYPHVVSLKRHQNKHLFKKKFDCDVCNASFRWASDFKRHKNTHTGEKPFQCQICNARFRQAGHLSTHHKIHTGEKPYVCDVCNARFNRSSNLRKHRNIHAGNREVKVRRKSR